MTARGLAVAALPDMAPERKYIAISKLDTTPAVACRRGGLTAYWLPHKRWPACLLTACGAARWLTLAGR